MRGRIVIAIAPLLVLAACGPKARSVADFKAHPDQATHIAAGCPASAAPGSDCATAQAARAQIASDKRLSLYKKSF